MSPFVRRLLTLAFAAGLLAACSVFDSGPASPTPAPEPTAPIGGQPQEPGPAAATAVPPGSLFEVTWTPAEPPRTLAAFELPSPFAEFVDVEGVWRLYAVAVDSGEPRLLQETGRWLQDPVWSLMDDTLSLSYLTRAEGSESFLRGYEQLDAATGSLNWDLLTDLAPFLSMSPDGTRFVMDEGSGRPFNRGPRAVWQPGGEALLLGSFTAEGLLEWSPDGRFFIATGYPGPVTTPQEQARDHYLIEPDRDEVVFIGRSQQGSSLNTAWSPDNGRIAFTLGEDFVIFDLSTRQSRTIPLGDGFQTFNEPSWSADGRYIAVEGGVVDVTAARVLLAPSPPPDEPAPSPVRDSAVSPDGSMLAWTESIFTSDCEGLQSSRALLKDVNTARETVLLGCGEDVFLDVEWVDEAHLLVRSADCDACEPRYFGIKLFSLPDGSMLDLTEGQEDGASYAISPDRRRILVGGAKLRLHDASGALLRVIDPPAGYKVTGLAWSRDGARFVFVVAPAEAFLP
jgi:WD40 repeat protein